VGVKDVGFRIKIPVARETTETQKALDKQKKTLVDIHKKELPKLTKTTKEYLKTAKTGFKEVGDASEHMGRTFSRSMGEGLRSLHEFGDKLEKVRSKVLNLKTALAGTAIGVAAIWGAKKLYEGGKQSLATKGRIQREFGDEAEGLENTARLAGRKAGISTDDAIKGLIPFRERLEDIEAGAQFRGMKKKLRGDQATALRNKNLAFGAGLLSRVSTLAPDLDQGQVGSVLADALSGPEGIKRLISEFNLSKRSRKISEANEKGEAFKFLRDDEKKKYGVTKKGQFLEQGDLVNILLERSGITDAAAEAKRKKLDFQLKSIGATAENALADIGSRAFDKFNHGLAKGGSLAEKFENAIKSPEGKRMLEGVADAVGSIAEGAVKVATTIPKIASFLSEHKTALLALGGGLLALKGASMLGGALGNASKIPGLGGLLGAVGKAPIPVYVVNQPGMPGAPGAADGALGWGKKLLGIAGAGGVGSGLLLAAAAAAAAYGGYKAGDYLGKHVKVVGALHNAGANALYSLTGEAASDKKLEDSEAARNMNQLKARAAAVAQRAQALEASGLNRGQALYYAEHQNETPPTINVTTQLVVDGHKIAEIVSNHQERSVKNATGRGASPTHAE
jgi:hypothetical protein